MGGFDAKQKPNPDGMLELLEKLWGSSIKIGNDYDYGDVKKHYAHAVKFFRKGGPDRKQMQRIDCFIFGERDAKVNPNAAGWFDNPDVAF